MAWNFPLTFDPKELFCLGVVSPLSQRRVGGWGECADSLILYSKQGFAPLCPCHGYYLDCCHDYYLKVFTRDKDWLFTLFLLLLPFWRASRRLIVNSTGAHLSLILGNAKRSWLIVNFQLEAIYLLPQDHKKK